MKGSGGKKRTWSTNCSGYSFGELVSARGNPFITSTDYVIPEVAKPACGGESSADEGFLDTPSTLLRVVSLSNHGSRLRRVGYDISVFSLIVDIKINVQLQ
jgi:hypothetical protein